MEKMMEQIFKIWF